ncbi:HNH endonuclease [Acinetobacter sp. ULE_I001]|uniref:HNH endonuclease n=1 Tax=unclassified Acinetobacter TaxID=196816 RepID=UPI003AF55A25
MIQWLRVNFDLLNCINCVQKKIDDYTWHHNPQSSPNTMQLVPDEFHSNKAVPHTGQNSLKIGK